MADIMDDHATHASINSEVGRGDTDQARNAGRDQTSHSLISQLQTVVNGVWAQPAIRVIFLLVGET
jgi:hypothetical protein